jgi:hypothetical protein
MVPLGDEAQVEVHFGPFGGSANLDTRYTQFAPNVPLAHKSFWTHPMVLLGDKAQVKAPFI